MTQRVLTIHRSTVEAAVAKLNPLLLDSNGRIKLLPHAFYESLSRVDLRAWCWARGRYGLPTLELVSWLKEQIGDRSALEVGAGNGDLGHHLGIPMTDSYAQSTPEVLMQMRLIGQPITEPPAAVKHFDAVDAVRRFRPKVAIASWVTQEWRPGDAAQTSTPNGVNEEALLSRVDTYIHIGNKTVHGNKRLLSLPHLAIKDVPTVGRREDWENNVIYRWDRG